MMDPADTKAPPVANFSINHFGPTVIHELKFSFEAYVNYNQYHRYGGSI